jgi:hypothetical protein
MFADVIARTDPTLSERERLIVECYLVLEPRPCWWPSPAEVTHAIEVMRTMPVGFNDELAETFGL